VVFPTAGPEPRHPSQLYEAALEGALLFAVMLWFARRAYGPQARGLLSGVFLIGYALGRMFAELFREPDVQIGYLAGGITMGQLLSLPMLVLGMFLVMRARRRVEASA
jgi:phosphatidylglycerol:prolipoprotein diacylglycerol transferase